MNDSAEGNSRKTRGQDKPWNWKQQGTPYLQGPHGKSSESHKRISHRGHESGPVVKSLHASGRSESVPSIHIKQLTVLHVTPVLGAPIATVGSCTHVSIPTYRHTGILIKNKKNKNKKMSGVVGSAHL